MDGVTKLAPVVALYAGRPEMLERVEAAMRVTQNNDACVAVTLAAARCSSPTVHDFQLGLNAPLMPHVCQSFTGPQTDYNRKL